MSTPILNYERLVILYGNDRATGDHAETASELRKRKATIVDEDFMNTVEGIDHLISQNEVTLEDCTALANDDVDVEVPSQIPSTGGCNRKVKKAKKSEGGFDKIYSTMNNVAEAPREMNQSMHENSKPLILDEELWSLLQELEFDPSLMSTIFYKLMSDRIMLRTILRCPMHLKKQVIMQLAFGSSNPNGP